MNNNGIILFKENGDVRYAPCQIEETDSDAIVKVYFEDPIDNRHESLYMHVKQMGYWRTPALSNISILVTYAAAI